MTPVDERCFPSEDQLAAWCRRVGDAGYRGTASKAHAELIDWLEGSLVALGLEVWRDEFTVRRWRPVPEGDLEGAGTLEVAGTDLPVAGAVPYSRPGQGTGKLVHVPPGEPITAENAAGRVVIRDFPDLPIPYDYHLGHAIHRSPDTEALRGEVWDRPGLADSILHADLLAAGTAGAAGVIIAFDLPRVEIAGYHEPHKGTHYRVPAVFVGVEQREALKAAAGQEATVGVHALVDDAPTHNLHARLPGSSSERAVLVTHTDGNTWVQENGIAALLAVATHLSAVPLDRRHRTTDFVFSTAHLHISREGSARHAATLDADYERGEITYVFPVEHLGVRELVPVERCDGPGRTLRFTGDPELLLWAAGPSDAIRRVVGDAIGRRDLERTVLLPGLGPAVEGQVPEIVSFGGLGTLFHVRLLPTTSVLTGSWSLWAPSFGEDAIDIALFRRQTLAIADVVASLDELPRDEIAGGYLDHRRARAAGATVGVEPTPPEVAP